MSLSQLPYKIQSIVCHHEQAAAGYELIRIQLKELTYFYCLLPYGNLFQIHFKSNARTLCKFPECPKDAALCDIMHRCDAGLSGGSGLRYDTQKAVKGLGLLYQMRRISRQQKCFFLFCQNRSAFQANPLGHNNILSRFGSFCRNDSVLFRFANTRNCENRLIYRFRHFRMSTCNLYVQLCTDRFHLRHELPDFQLFNRFRQQCRYEQRYRLRAGAGQIIGSDMYCHHSRIFRCPCNRICRHDKHFILRKR